MRGLHFPFALRSLALSVLVMACTQSVSASPVIAEIGFDLTFADAQNVDGVVDFSSNEFIEITNLDTEFDASQLGIVIIEGDRDNSGGLSNTPNPGRVDFSLALGPLLTPTTLAAGEFLLVIEGASYTSDVIRVLDLCVFFPSDPCPADLATPLNLELGSQTFFLVDLAGSALPAVGTDFDVDNDGVIETPFEFTVLDEVAVDDGGGQPDCVGGVDVFYLTLPTSQTLCQFNAFTGVFEEDLANGAVIFRDTTGEFHTAELEGPVGISAELLTLTNSTNPLYNGSAATPGSPNEVVAPPAISLTVVPAVATVPLGGSAVFNLDISRTNFIDPADLFITGLPKGAIATFTADPDPGPDNSFNPLTITVPNNTVAPAGSSTVTFSSSTSDALVNIGTLSLTIAPPVAPLTDVSSQFTLGLSGAVNFSFSRQPLEIENNSTQDIAGPVYVALSNLPVGASVTGVSVNGLTTAAVVGTGLDGSPLVQVLDVGETLGIGASTTLILDVQNDSPFQLDFDPVLLTASLQDITSFTNITKQGIVLTNRVRQQATITYNGEAPLTGLFYLTTGGLPNGATQTTATTSVNGIPALGLTELSLTPGLSIIKTLEFDNPTPFALNPQIAVFQASPGSTVPKVLKKRVIKNKALQGPTKR